MKRMTNVNERRRRKKEGKQQKKREQHMMRMTRMNAWKKTMLMMKTRI